MKEKEFINANLIVMQNNGHKHKPRQGTKFRTSFKLIKS